MKKAFFIILFEVLFINNAKSQDIGIFKELGLIIGYNYNIEDSDFRKYHLIELGLKKSTYNNYHHPVSSSIYLSNELGLNTNKFVWGPKVGAYVSFWMIALGAETVYYTDFHEGSLRIVPYFGLGFHQVKLTVNPQIRITNKDFPLNLLSINLTIRPFVIKSKKIN